MNRIAITSSTLALMLVAISGCKQEAPPAPPAANTAASNCLQYAPGMVTLIGMTSTQTVSAPDKDSREALLLTLDQPICIATHAARAAESPAVESVSVIELVPQSDFAAVYSLAGQRVSAHGGLVPISGDGAAAKTGLVLRTIKPAP